MGSKRTYKNLEQCDLVDITKYGSIFIVVQAKHEFTYDTVFYNNYVRTALVWSDATNMFHETVSNTDLDSSKHSFFLIVR